MKSQLFKTAWELFKKFNVTFSQALVEAWKSIKKEIVRSEVLKMDLSEWKSEIEFNHLTKNLKAVFYSLRVQISQSVNNIGASYCYGIGVYNGD